MKVLCPEIIDAWMYEVVEPPSMVKHFKLNTDDAWFPD